MRPAIHAALLALAGCAGPAPGDDEADTDAVADTDGGGETDADTDGGDTDDDETDGGDTDPLPDCSLGCAVDTWDVDANPLTGVCGCEYACTATSAADPYDAAFTDSNCDGGDGLVDACVYVSATLGADGAAGTRADPLRSIAAALVVAEANALPHVCLSSETFEEMFVVPEGVTLVGRFDAFDPDFAFRRKAGVTTVNGEEVVGDAP